MEDHLHKIDKQVSDNFISFESRMRTMLDAILLMAKENADLKEMVRGKDKEEGSSGVMTTMTKPPNLEACWVDYAWALVEQIIYSPKAELLAQNNWPQINVVVKLFKIGIINEAQSYESELKIARMLLLHPNIIDTFGSSANGKTDERAILYHYAENGSLQSHIGELDWGTIMKTFEGIASALQCIHEHGYVHRDVKPPNILFTGDYTPKLADFGSTQLNKSDEFNMTAGYVDPDIIDRSNSRVHTYHDLFGLGVTVLQLIADWKTPFNPREPTEKIADWAAKEHDEGRSIISTRLQGKWSTKWEEQLVQIVLLLTAQPANERPELPYVISLIKELRKIYDEDDKEKEIYLTDQEVYDEDMMKTTKKKKSKKVFKFL